MYAGRRSAWRSCAGAAENEERDTGGQWEAGLKHVAGREAGLACAVHSAARKGVLGA